MAYFLDLFSPETYAAFKRSQQDVSGFRYRHRFAAERVKPGDKLVCYLTKLSRWFGILEVIEGPFQDSTPIFYPDDDPFVVRFKVKPLVWLDADKAVPIQNSDVWKILSFTKEHDPKSPRWTGKIRTSLVPISRADGEFLERLLFAQREGQRTFPLEDSEVAAFETHTVRRADKTVAVTVPTELTVERTTQDDEEVESEVRESIKVQAILAEIGSQMGLKIWIPKADRGGVLKEWKEPGSALLDRLPLNYDDATLKLKLS